ncbi:MAG: 3-hydroxy acid dehydrogenase/malonic semialdehyde reductase [Gammaproteobacteria bacterium]
MNDKLPKRLLVVGASGGIGREVSARMASEGWEIFAQGRNVDRLEATLGSVRNNGGHGQYFESELTDLAQIDELARWANQDNRLNAVVWSAGGGRSVSSGPEALDEWERTFATSLHAPMRLTALTLPTIKQNQGAYLYICGMYAKIGMAKMAAHCAARHGLEGFTKALFEEVREEGVCVHLLHPGFVYSSLTNTEKLDPDKMIQASDIADMVAMALTLPKNACVTEMIVRPQRSPYK